MRRFFFFNSVSDKKKCFSKTKNKVMNKKNEVLANEMHFVLILFKSFEFLHIFILITVRFFFQIIKLLKKIIVLAK